MPLSDTRSCPRRTQKRPQSTVDQLNEAILKRGDEPIAIESDCREGICGTCGVCIDRQAHGPVPNITTCSLRMRSFPDKATITVEPFRAAAAMDSAACIGCGACAAACPNASASLFVSAKVRQMALLPQGKAERARRVLAMVEQMDKEGFGDCSNHGECEAACPKAISIENISVLRREYVRATVAKH